MQGSSAEPAEVRHVFVSYARADEEVAHRVANALKECFLPIFIDSTLRVGSHWEDELEIALNKAFAVLVLWSPAAVQSQWVRMEARYAVERQIYCPAIISPCDLPFGFRHLECANLDAFGFTGERNREWVLLLEALGRLKDTLAIPVAPEEAQLLFELGRRYRNGIGVPQHDGMAFAWFQRALAAGHPDATQAIFELRSLGR